jgi:hypothetical protein
MNGVPMKLQMKHIVYNPWKAQDKFGLTPKNLLKNLKIWLYSKF